MNNLRSRLAEAFAHEAREHSKHGATGRNVLMRLLVSMYVCVCAYMCALVCLLFGGGEKFTHGGSGQSSVQLWV